MSQASKIQWNEQSMISEREKHGIKDLIIDQTCAETYPCQHLNQKIIYSDGREEELKAGSVELWRDYKNVMNEWQFDHFQTYDK